MEFKDLKNHIFLHSFVNKPLFFNSLRYLVTGNQESIKSFVRKNLRRYQCQTILDICCGTGDFVQKKKKYAGIDINPFFISFAREKYGNKKTTFICGNALNLPFPNNYFEASLLVSTLHHFSDAGVEQLLKEAKRVTKKLIIIVDLIPYPSNFLKRFFVLLDQGNYVRKEKEKEKIVSRFLKIKSTDKLSAGQAEQYGIIAEPK